MSAFAYIWILAGVAAFAFASIDRKPYLAKDHLVIPGWRGRFGPPKRSIDIKTITGIERKTINADKATEAEQYDLVLRDGERISLGAYVLNVRKVSAVTAYVPSMARSFAGALGLEIVDVDR